MGYNRQWWMTDNGEWQTMANKNWEWQTVGNDIQCGMTDNWKWQTMEMIDNGNDRQWGWYILRNDKIIGNGGGEWQSRIVSPRLVHCSKVMQMSWMIHNRNNGIKSIQMQDNKV